MIEGPEDAMFAQLPRSVQPAISGRLKEGLVLFKVHRSPSDTDMLGDAIIARGNEEALWLTGYEDRILYDCRKSGLEKFAGLIILHFRMSGLRIKAIRSFLPMHPVHPIRSIRSRKRQSWMRWQMQG